MVQQIQVKRGIGRWIDDRVFRTGIGWRVNRRDRLGRIIRVSRQDPIGWIAIILPRIDWLDWIRNGNWKRVRSGLSNGLVLFRRHR